MMRLILNVSGWFLLFAVYSVLGWACETAACSIEARKWVNRGFLAGPLCPIYGVGALLIILLLTPFQSDPLVLYLAGTILTSALEYATGWLMEKLFHTRWWDYSHRRFHLQGRICLGNSLAFGVMAAVVLYVAQPLLSRLLRAVPPAGILAAAAVLAALLAADTAMSVRSVLQLNGRLAELQKVLDELRERAGAGALLQEKIGGLKESVDEGLRSRLAALGERKNALLALTRDRLLQHRLIDAFPHMASLRNNESLLCLRESLERRRAQHKKRREK